MSKRGTITGRRVVLFIGLLVTVACGPKASQTEAMTLARLEASETKMAQLEERLATIEDKAGRLDGVAEGVQLLLEKLDQLGAGVAPGERRKPSPTAVYSMPIEGDPFVGPKFAKVTMVKGYDFYCGYCDKVLPVLSKLREMYGKDLKIVYKNFVIHDEVARLPALAACAAHKQGKFMPMFEQIWIRGLRARVELDEGMLLKIATLLKLNREKFISDMRGCEDKVQSDFETMSAVGSTGTPAFYINGRFLAGALPLERYKRVIDQELDKANRALKQGVKLKEYYGSLVKTGRTSL